MVKRYKIDNPDAVWVGIEENVNGAWVRFDDIKHLLNLPKAEGGSRNADPQLSDGWRYAREELPTESGKYLVCLDNEDNPEVFEADYLPDKKTFRHDRECNYQRYTYYDPYHVLWIRYPKPPTFR